MSVSALDCSGRGWSTRRTRPLARAARRGGVSMFFIAPYLAAALAMLTVGMSSDAAPAASIVVATLAALGVASAALSLRQVSR